MQQAFAFARVQEANIKKHKIRFTHKTPLLSTPTKNPYPESPIPLRPHPNNQKPNTKPYRNLGAPFKSNTFRKTLTPSEFDERRAKGLFFFCDERFVSGHRCRGKKPQNYHLELEGEEEEEENIQELAQISVHALSGVTDYQTLRVTGHHGKKKLQVLLDPESTHNFIDTSIAHKLG